MKILIALILLATAAGTAHAVRLSSITYHPVHLTDTDIKENGFILADITTDPYKVPACGSTVTVETDEYIWKWNTRSDGHYLTESQIYDFKYVEEFTCTDGNAKPMGEWIKYDKVPHEIDWIGHLIIELGLRSDGAVVWRKKKK